VDREALIARKHEVRQQLERAQSALAQIENAAGPKRDRRRIAQLQNQVDRLMAEEFNLRLAIDRSAQNG
jgi:flagellar biosynthesis/type III secretory pathway chaperone